MKFRPIPCPGTPPAAFAVSILRGVILPLVSLSFFALLATGAPETRVLIPLTGEARLLDTADAAPRGWTQPTFDDSAWQAAPGIVARLDSEGALRRFGQDEPGTQLRAGGETAYFRFAFELEALP